MLKRQLAMLTLAVTFVVPLIARANERSGDVAVAQAYIKEIQADEKAYAAAHKSAFFKELAKGQTPRATVVTCSDSRVQSSIFDKTPEGDMFVVRNIGNQLITAKGSVQYGVNHLGSSLLLFIGHSSCGAIKAAGGDYSTLEEPIRKELDSINIAKGGLNINGVKTNVNNQVEAALKEWEDKVKSGELLVVGAVYDFADDMKLGAGNLNIINMNGETDPAKIRNASVSAKKAEHGHDHH